MFVYYIVKATTTHGHFFPTKVKGEHTCNNSIIIMTGKGKGKRSRHQTNKGGSRVSPHEKRISRMVRKMSTTVSTIADKLELLETRVKVLEEREDTKTIIAQNIFSAANERYLEMEAKVRNCTSVINTLNQKYTKIDDLTARVQIMDKQISEQNEAQIPLYTSNENLDIAFYGLNTYNDVTTSVNRLFKDMNLGNTKCISAYMTPTRPAMSRPGVVIVEMRCLTDKRAVPERKRNIRHMPQYQHVFL